MGNEFGKAYMLFTKKLYDTKALNRGEYIKELAQVDELRKAAAREKRLERLEEAQIALNEVQSRIAQKTEGNAVTQSNLQTEGLGYDTASRGVASRVAKATEGDVIKGATLDVEGKAESNRQSKAAFYYTEKNLEYGLEEHKIQLGILKKTAPLTFRMMEESYMQAKTATQAGIDSLNHNKTLYPLEEANARFRNDILNPLMATTQKLQNTLATDANARADVGTNQSYVNALSQQIIYETQTYGEPFPETRQMYADAIKGLAAANNETTGSDYNIPTTIKLNEGQKKNYAAYYPEIKAAALRFNVPLHIALGLFYTESRFNPTAVSPTGAMGMGQFTRGTQKEMQLPKHAKILGFNFRDRKDHSTNIIASMYYLSTRPGKTWEEKLKHYGDPNQASYVPLVMGAAEQFGKSTPSPQGGKIPESLTPAGTMAEGGEPLIHSNEEKVLLLERRKAKEAAMTNAQTMAVQEANAACKAGSEDYATCFPSKYDVILRVLIKQIEDMYPSEDVEIPEKRKGGDEPTSGLNEDNWFDFVSGASGLK